MSILSDNELIEEIKKVKIEKALPKDWQDFIKQRYLSWHISRSGANRGGSHEIMVKFFQTIGEGRIRIDTWYGLGAIRSAAKEAGFILKNNKLTDSYILFKNKKDKLPLFIFNPKLLDTKDNKTEQKTKETEFGQ